MCNNYRLRCSLDRLTHRGAGLAIAAFALAVVGCGGGGGGSTSSTPAATARFRQTNIVADVAGVATLTDPNLVNPWGIAFSPTGNFWVANNGTGTSTLYNADGAAGTGPTGYYGATGAAQTLVVAIPASAGGGGAAAAGSPTGAVFAGGAGFSGGPQFVFASEDGALSTWGSGSKAAAQADLSASGTVFKGLAIAPSGGGTYLYATDFHNARVAVFNTSFQPANLAGSFADPGIPAGFAPFGIQAIAGNLYVTYARQRAPENHDDSAGVGNGFVDVFRPDGTLLRRLASGGNLNSPWGLALAPAGFGPYGGDILVGNFGDGAIGVYDPNTGGYVGRLMDTAGNPLVIPGLWALSFGNGAGAGGTGILYFTSGPGGEKHGIFGSLQPK